MYAVLRQTEVALIAYGGRDQEFFVHLFFQQLVIRYLVDPVRFSLPGTTQGCVDSWWEGAGVFIAVKLLDGFGNSFKLSEISLNCDDVFLIFNPRTQSNYVLLAINWTILIIM